MSVKDFDYSKLRGAIREKYDTEEAFSKAMRISRATLSAKLNQTKEFTHGEMVKACDLLGYSTADVSELFFTRRV